MNWSFLKIFTGLFFVGISLLTAQEIKIIDKPIIYDSTRVRLSLAYLKERHGLVKNTPTITPVMVVLHWTAAKTFSSTFNAFNQPKLPNGDRKDIAQVSSLNTSSQYLIDRDGTIYRLMPDNYFARHVIGLNYCAIGIENVGSSNFPLTEAQLLANEQLVRYLHKKYHIQYLIGHYEYTKFKTTSLWKETNPKYQTGKNDPGADFMKLIRYNLKDLGLKGAPTP
ncbi:peptidoglycan recognition family protein [Pedobacter sp. ASV28]|uniref:peptidoglycan recognition protein family protein n=1 Tax=Pedobacter sp. ASV28 TaxID=2795123 RepID=UPI0018EAD9EA|nr:peptidoglycan recognition family protein [Pedobacter sp. ASV28]